MAEAMIIQKKLLKNSKSTQTGDFIEFLVYLDKTKTVRLYYSSSYKDYVLCLHFSNNKRYIVTKPMWKIFRKHLVNIDNVLNR